MKKFSYLLATAALVLAGCANNDYLGEYPTKSQNEGGAIQFSYNLPNMTRAMEGDIAAEKLGYAFYVWGTKTIASEDAQLVFGKTEGSTLPYYVWYVDNSKETTDSNTNNWEYVGTNGQQYGTENYQVTLAQDQTIKYWDALAQYNFVAYTAKDKDGSATTHSAPAITTTTESGKNTIQQISFVADSSQMENIFFSDRVVVNGSTPEDNTPVKFTFRTGAAKVRLGIYETIPGYDVIDVNFKHSGTYGTTAVAVGTFFQKESYEVTWGNKNGDHAIVTGLTTDFASPKDGASTGTAFSFGTIADDKINETSAAPTYTAGAKSNWTPVLPTQVSEDMQFTVKFTLKNTTTGETITLSDKVVTVPAVYLKYTANYAYTYVLKISEDANGLYPITFDACVKEDVLQNQGTISTVADYSVTSFQDGSVTGDNIDYSTKPLYFVTINNSNNTTLVPTLADLATVSDTEKNACIVKLSTGTYTENDVIAKLNGKGDKSLSLTDVDGEAVTDKVTLVDGTNYTINALSWTPSEKATYAYILTTKTKTATEDGEYAVKIFTIN